MSKSIGGAFQPQRDYDCTGIWTFSGVTGHTAADTHTGAETHTGVETHTGAETHTGVETHTGAETHSGAEVFSGSPTGIVVSKTVAFIENATSTTFTGTVVIPAGATLIDIVVTSSVLWSKASTRLIVGDAQSNNGWFTSTNLNATDLLVGERLSAAGGVQAWGGVNGTYLVSATGVMGQATATASGPYYTSASSVIGVVTVTPGAGAAGRSFMTVLYSVGTAVAQVLA